MMTESEARTKWCPQVDLNAYRDSVMQALHRDEGARCIGSGCMFWRWTYLRADDESPPPKGERGWVKSSRYTFHKQTETGFCGMAGPVGP